MLGPHKDALSRYQTKIARGLFAVILFEIPYVMENNQIPQRIADFLAEHPPFSFLNLSDLLGLAKYIDIRYLPKGEILFSEGEAPKQEFFVVREGTVQIHQHQTQTLVDVCDKGDVFGVRALLAQDQYLATAQAAEDTLLYCIPVTAGREILMQVPKVALYFASGFASGKTLANQRFFNLNVGTANFYGATHKLSGIKTLVACAPETPIKDAANLMVANRVSALLILNHQQLPLGIVTDKDLRTLVATGKVGTDAAVHQIMSSPVKCLKDGLTHADYLIAMLQHNIHHLCITKDGTPQTAAIGMLTEHDLLLEQGQHPAVLLRELVAASEPEAIAQLRKKASAMLEKGIQAQTPIDFLMRMATAYNDLLVQKAISLASMDLGPAPCDYCWLALGSLGRGEQILQTDQDHALIFERHEHQPYFLKLADAVVALLHSWGFEKDPAGIMANNPKWCLPIADWQQNFSAWLKTPEPQAVLHTTIFFDFRAVAGNPALANNLREYLQELTSNAALFLSYLAKDALQTPAPLSFFKNFVLEREGSHKDAFDLKLRVGLPLADCARVLSLQLPNVPTGTAARYQALAVAEPQNAALFEAAAAATFYVIQLRARFGFDNQDQGRFIQPQVLTKMERQSLRNIFDTIADLQELVGVRYQTQMLR